MRPLRAIPGAPLSMVRPGFSSGSSSVRRRAMTTWCSKGVGQPAKKLCMVMSSSWASKREMASQVSPHARPHLHHKAATAMCARTFCRVMRAALGTRASATNYLGAGTAKAKPPVPWERELPSAATPRNPGGAHEDVESLVLRAAVRTTFGSRLQLQGRSARHIYRVTSSRVRAPP